MTSGTDGLHNRMNSTDSILVLQGVIFYMYCCIVAVGSRIDSKLVYTIYFVLKSKLLLLFCLIH